jgi:hypothetical protein
VPPQSNSRAAFSGWEGLPAENITSAIYPQYISKMRAEKPAHTMGFQAIKRIFTSLYIPMEDLVGNQLITEFISDRHRSKGTEDKSWNLSATAQHGKILLNEAW